MPSTDDLNIGIGKPELIGRDPTASGLVLIRVPLQPEPTAEWREVFERGVGEYGWSISMHPPRITGAAEVTIRPPDDEVEAYIEALRERVQAANEYYNRHIAPDLQRAHEALEKARSEEERRLEGVRRRLENL